MRYLLLSFVFACSLFLSSCLTVLTDLGTAAILGYSPSQIDENMRTLDPNASYSKRTSIFLKLLGDEERMKKLSSSVGSVAEKVLANSRPTTEKITISTPEYEIPCYLVFPKERSYSRDYPVVFFAHGGGFELWSFSEYESLCCEIADKSDACVLFYEFRKAPEFKFPCGVNDTYEAYKWLINSENSSKYHLDNENIVLMGDSSGGNFVSGLMIRIAEEKLLFPRGVVLLYPSTDVSHNFNYSRLVFGGLEDPNRYYATSFEYLVDVQNKYLSSPQDAFKPYASPLIMLEGLIEVKGFDNPCKQYKANLTLPLDYFPPHLVCVPQIDSLRDEGKMYYALLRCFHAPCKLIEYSGMFHGFAMASIAIDAAERCINDSVKFIKEVLK